jgi:threonine dehydratase
VTALRLEDIDAAAARIAGHVQRTPLLPADGLGIPDLWLKAESLQRTGSFKVRGAFNAVLQLTSAERAAGVITLSAGNHGIALALAAREQSVGCVVVAPREGSPVKFDAMRALGAELVPVPRAELAARVEEERERRALTLVHPFDDPRVMAGQGTVGPEILDALPEVNTVLVPVGGGGLLAGMAIAMKSRRPGLRLVGVEPEGARVVQDSLVAGHPMNAVRNETVADGLTAPYTRPAPLEIIRRSVDHMVTVSDEQIVNAVRRLALQGKLIAEPAGATALAALLSGVVPHVDRPAVAVISGGNVDPAKLADWLRVT